MELLNQQDNEGCTLLHYASQIGCCSFMNLFMKHGAKITLKNNLKQSPLHFAAKYGRYSSCVQILKAENFKTFINEKDSQGMLFQKFM